MTILDTAAAAEMAAFRRQGATAFAEVIRAKAMRMNPEEIKVAGFSSRAHNILRDPGATVKSAVDAGSMLDGNWAAALSPIGGLSKNFLGSLAGISVFDALLPSMLTVPLQTKIAFVTAAGTGASVGEGQAKPMTSLSLGNLPVQEQKSVAFVIVSKEVLKISNFNATQLFLSELQKAVALVTDSTFIALLKSGVTPIASSGVNVAAVRRDLRAAFGAIQGDASSQYYIVMPSATAKALAFSIGESGAEAFPDLSPNGGSISKIPVIVNDAVSGEIVIVDAAQVAANAGFVETKTSEAADIQFQTTPDSPPTTATVLKSLWQTGHICVMAERYFAAQRLRSAAVAVIGGVNYSGNSPA